MCQEYIEVWKLLRKGAKDQKEKKFSFQKNPTHKKFSFEELQLILCVTTISPSFPRVPRVVWSRFAGSGPVKLLTSEAEICLKFPFSHFL